MKKQNSLLRIQKEDEQSEESDVDLDVEHSRGENLYVKPMVESEEAETLTESPKESRKTPKTRKKGIIYISQIPKHMNVAICRELMEQFGEVERIFLQPDSKGMTKKANKKKKNVTFTEGWVEFQKKKVAKWVVQNINVTPISTKKGSKFCDVLWSLKYLPGFKWTHLSERLTYERAVSHQKLQIATSKARKEANFFQHNLDKSENVRTKKFVSSKKTE